VHAATQVITKLLRQAFSGRIWEGFHTVKFTGYNFRGAQGRMYPSEGHLARKVVDGLALYAGDSEEARRHLQLVHKLLIRHLLPLGI
jgi:hypothetical protein